MFTDAIERLYRLSPRALTDGELLSLVLDSGEAAALLEQGLRALSQSAPAEWLPHPTLSPTRAARMLAAFELGRRAMESPPRNLKLVSPRAICDFLAPHLANLR